MQLGDTIRILRRHWLAVTVCSLLGLLISAAGSLVVKPEYTASTQLFVAIQNAGSVQELQQGNTFSQARVQSYVDVVSTPAVLQPVIDTLGLPVSPAELKDSVTASSDLRTVLITITATDVSPVQAAALAQAVSDSLISVIDELESPSGDASSPVKLSLVKPATAPTSPSSPDLGMNLFIGLVVGILSGIAYALLRTLMDVKVRTDADVRQIRDIPTLGAVTFDADAEKRPLITDIHSQSPRAESFRQIRTNLSFAQIGEGPSTILVTSSLPAEGKSTTAVNMAIALAQSGKSVALIDGDLRRPRVHDYLGLEGGVGLTTVLVGKADISDVLQEWGEDQLYVLTSGPIPPNPSEMLGSQAMKALLDDLDSKFDVVIIDAPPLLPVTDAAVLAQRVGGVVLVIGSSKLKTPELEKSFQSLEMVKANILGVVMNLLPIKGPDAYSYTEYSYESRPGHPHMTDETMSRQATLDNLRAKGQARISR